MVTKVVDGQVVALLYYYIYFPFLLQKKCQSVQNNYKNMIFCYQSIDPLLNHFEFYILCIFSQIHEY